MSGDRYYTLAEGTPMPKKELALRSNERQAAPLQVTAPLF